MDYSHPQILRFPNREGGAAREQYIPLSRNELVQRLVNGHKFGPKERETLLVVGQLLSAILHREYNQRLEELKGAYAPFDPDGLAAERLSDAVQMQQATVVFERFGELLQRANFRKLSDDELRATLQNSSDWGLRVKVDFTLFEKLEVFVRGDALGRWERCNWQTSYVKETVEIPIYERLALIFRLRADRPSPKGLKPGMITLKLFKNIPQMDVEMLLPGSRVRMTWFDQAKIVLPTFSGLALAAFKVFKGAVVFAFASAYGLLMSLIFVFGMLGYGLRSFFGYLNTKERYQHNLTRSLYYQNLDNNAGVLFRLLDEAEDQDFREAMIAWFLLWQSAGTSGWTAEALDIEAERKLREWLKHEVDFEVADALEKLQRFGLAEQLGSNRWRATPLALARFRLERLWNDLNPVRQSEQQQAN